GITQMLSPQQAGLAGVADNGTSYYFNGPVNSAAQGEPLPLVYGEMIVGSKVVSSGIYTEDRV
ncbi:tail assembly protein, partial [Burkholderia thailandensis]|nr:tail assembly protein [Burkholderia thailandensis]